MQLNSGQTVEEQVIYVLSQYSARQKIGMEELIGRDLGIQGADGVEVLDELEERFKVDLDPLVQANTTFLPPRWVDRLLGRKHGPPTADLTVRQLVDYIQLLGR